MRKAFTLVELLIVITTLPFVAIVLDRLLLALLIDIPRSSQLVQENTTLLNMLQQMQQDIDRAKQLPSSFAGQTASDKLFLIELPDGTVCYQLENGCVLRWQLTDTQRLDGQHATVWSLPNTVIQWQLWRKNDKGYAVEIETYIKHKLRKKWQKKMPGSYLYFTGVF
jgi:type II secretory pathway component PulJ